MQNKHIRILNIDILNTTKEQLLDQLSGGVVYTPNIDHLINLQDDKAFYEAYKSADVVLLDSQVLFYLYNLFGKQIQEKISGVDLFPDFCRYHASNRSITIFLLGGLDDSVHKASEALNKMAGREIVVDTYSARKGFENDEKESMKIIELIRNSGANVLAVGVGSPRQEKWIAKYKPLLPEINVFFAVGGTFDILSGKRGRAPKIMQKLGLEWLFRIFQEPRRLFKRYLIIDIRFFYYFLLERFGLYKDPFGK